MEVNFWILAEHLPLIRLKNAIQNVLNCDCVRDGGGYCVHDVGDFLHFLLLFSPAELFSLVNRENASLYFITQRH